MKSSFLGSSTNEYSSESEYEADRFTNPQLAQEKLKSTLEAGQYWYFLQTFRREERPAKLKTVLTEISDEEYWKLVRVYWVQDYDCSTVLELIRSDRPYKELFMRPHEHERLNSLPETIPVFRGCPKDKPFPGWCWTLSEKVARKFGGQHHSEGDGVILRGTCSKKDVVAFLDFDGYRESEIIAAPDCVKVTHQRRALSLSDETNGPKPKWTPYECTEDCKN